MKNMLFKPLLIKLSLPLVMIGGIFASYQVAGPTLSRIKKYYSAKQEIQQKLKEDDINQERVVVRYKDGTNMEAIDQKAVKHTGEKQKFYKPKHKAPLVQTVHKKKNQSLEDLMMDYMMDPDVESVDVVHKGEILWTDSGTKTYSDDFDQVPTPATGDHWYFDKINLPELWDDQECATAGLDCGGSSSVTVAVLDTGLAFEDYTATYEWSGNNYNNIVYADASEINGINLYTNSSDPYDGGDGDGNGVCDDYHGFDAGIWVENYGDPWNCSGSNDTKKEGHPNDDYGHGTYVTGIIASQTDNAAGSVSAAHEVTIMPIKANIPFTGSFWDDVFYYGVLYAVDNGADIINGSIGWCNGSALLKAAVDYAEANGVLMVFASGNSICGWSTPLAYPANYNDSNMIAVGAINSNNSKSSYSQYGSSLDIVAPVGDGGVSGDATYHQFLNCAWTCSPSSNFTQFKYSFGTGTSYASPQVAAGAAIIKSLHSNVTAVDMNYLLKQSATDLGDRNKFGFGLLNLEEVWNSDYFYDREKWYTSTGWNINKVKGHATGDFDNDNDDDTVALYDLGPGKIRFWVFESNGTNTFSPANWFTSTSGWSIKNIKHISAGDFDNDGNSDIAVLYDLGSGKIRLWIFESNGSNAFTPVKWFTSTGWHASKMKLMSAGDFDNDNDSDIAVLYNLGPDKIRLWVFDSNGSDSFTAQNWYTSTGWGISKIRFMTAGDFNNDADEDVALLYDLRPGQIRLWVFDSNGSDSFTAQNWYTATSSWNIDKVKGLSAGDFDGDNDTDVTTLYKLGPTQTRFWVFKSNGSNAFSGEGWFTSASSWDIDNVKYMSAGDYDNNGTDDANLLYKLEPSKIRVWVFMR